MRDTITVNLIVNKDYFPPAWPSPPSLLLQTELLAALSANPLLLTLRASQRPPGNNEYVLFCIIFE
jgi:hypothetical protein